MKTKSILLILISALFVLQGCKTSSATDDVSQSVIWKVPDKSRLVNAGSLAEKYSHAFYYVDKHSLIHTWSTNYFISDDVVLGFNLSTNKIDWCAPGLSPQNYLVFPNNEVCVQDITFKINMLASSSSNQDRFVGFYSFSKVKIQGLIRFPSFFSDEQLRKSTKKILANFKIV